jgi:D-alanyl-D-alanine carboxypeptidase/D-alanyl-D-alanine-endopeptidase (penicillin-binding protein 4)
VAQPGTEDGQSGSTSPADDVVRPATDVVRPGTGVVRPGTGVVRPGTDVVRPSGTSPDGSAKAVAAVPETPEKPPEPIHVVLPVIPVKPVKQGFLDRLVAGKSEAERAAEEAKRAEEARRKAEEEQRKAEEKARRKAEEEQRKAEEERRKAEEKARRKAEEEQRKAEEEQRKAEEKARKEAERLRREQEEAEEKARAKAEEKARKEAERLRREQEEAAERARRAEERALRRAREDEDDEDEAYDDRGYDDRTYGDRGYGDRTYGDRPRDFAGPVTAPRTRPTEGVPARPAPAAPPRAPAGPTAPPRPGPPVPLPPTRPSRRPTPEWPPPQRGARGRPRRPGRDGYADYGHDDYEYDDYEYAYDREPARRPWWHWAVAVVAAIALGAGSAAITGVIAPDTTVAYHAGVDMGQLASVPEPIGDGAALPSRTGLEAALAPLFADAGLGGQVAGTVADGLTGEVLWDRGGDTAVVPASTAKVLVAAAVLYARGPNYRIPTRVVAGPNPGEVVIIGGGDPTLAAGEVSAYAGAARLDQLAEQVRQALGTTMPTKVILDTSLFSGPTTHPSWFAADVSSGVISNITALMTDGARVNPADRRSTTARHAEPDLAAARQFAQALGVPPNQIVRGTAPPNARVLGEVQSQPLARIVETMLLESDNVLAEMLARQVAVAKGVPASFDGATQAVRTVLTELRVPMPASGGLVDGSGLSDDNRVTTNQLVAVLHRAMSPDHPQLRVLLSGLPVAGYSGTLGERGGAGLGVVRAKTGTLSHVNALAGYVVDADGRTLVFAVVADATSNKWAAEGALDRIAAQISRCGCR